MHRAIEEHQHPQRELRSEGAPDGSHGWSADRAAVEAQPVEFVVFLGFRPEGAAEFPDSLSQKPSGTIGMRTAHRALTRAYVGWE